MPTINQLKYNEVKDKKFEIVAYTDKDEFRCVKIVDGLDKSIHRRLLVEQKKYLSKNNKTNCYLCNSSLKNIVFIKCIDDDKILTVGYEKCITALGEITQTCDTCHSKYEVRPIDSRSGLTEKLNPLVPKNITIKMCPNCVKCKSIHSKNSECIKCDVVYNNWYVERHKEDIINYPVDTCNNCLGEYPSRFNECGLCYKCEDLPSVDRCIKNNRLIKKFKVVDGECICKSCFVSNIPSQLRRMINNLLLDGLAYADNHIKSFHNQMGLLLIRILYNKLLIGLPHFKPILDYSTTEISLKYDGMRECIEKEIDIHYEILIERGLYGKWSFNQRIGKNYTKYMNELISSIIDGNQSPIKSKYDNIMTVIPNFKVYTLKKTTMNSNKYLYWFMESIINKKYFNEWVSVMRLAKRAKQEAVNKAKREKEEEDLFNAMFLKQYQYKSDVLFGEIHRINRCEYKTLTTKLQDIIDTRGKVKTLEQLKIDELQAVENEIQRLTETVISKKDLKKQINMIRRPDISYMDYRIKKAQEEEELHIKETVMKKEFDDYKDRFMSRDIDVRDALIQYKKELRESVGQEP